MEWDKYKRLHIGSRLTLLPKKFVGLVFAIQWLLFLISELQTKDYDPYCLPPPIEQTKFRPRGNNSTKVSQSMKDRAQV